jgi:hypothetical protein
MGSLWNDIRHSLQMFWKNPGFAIAAIAAMARGIWREYGDLFHSARVKS